MDLICSNEVWWPHCHMEAQVLNWASTAFLHNHMLRARVHFMMLGVGLPIGQIWIWPELTCNCLTDLWYDERWLPAPTCRPVTESQRCNLQRVLFRSTIHLISLSQAEQRIQLHVCMVYPIPLQALHVVTIRLCTRRCPEFGQCLCWLPLFVTLSVSRLTWSIVTWSFWVMDKSINCLNVISVASVWTTYVVHTWKL
jgi:hypothetical protein